MAKMIPPLAVPSILVSVIPVTPAADCVLAGGCVQNDQSFMRRGRVQLAEHAPDLLQFLHEIVLGVQPPGGVGDQQVRFARLRRRQRVVDDRGRIGAGGLRDDRYVQALTPGLQLLDRRRAEGIAGR